MCNMECERVEMLGNSLDLVGAVVRMRAGFGFSSALRFGRPVGIHAQLLGQVHVPSLGHFSPSAAQPGEAFSSIQVYSFL